MKFLPSALLLLFLFSCNNSDSTSSKSLSSTATNVVSGAKIYKNKCVLCHGVKGDLQLNGAFDLTKSALSVEEREKVILNGRKTMTPFNGILNAAEIKSVAEYTIKLKND